MKQDLISNIVFKDSTSILSGTRLIQFFFEVIFYLSFLLNLIFFQFLQFNIYI